ncbi:hypothetical protein TSAR_002982 [Trichomalopsis sarcophagae]|uniref:Uncharacterized protein n=1 Tax=Trichomalopsis sarcophagae TaxID=543379 RepID=A0A232FBG4_9HYME|nr:hypothetical protein TSAR_002982 [Trichomalopsis sarcophagae]
MSLFSVKLQETTLILITLGTGDDINTVYPWHQKVLLTKTTKKVLLTKTTKAVAQPLVVSGISVRSPSRGIIQVENVGEKVNRQQVERIFACDEIISDVNIDIDALETIVEQSIELAASNVQNTNWIDKETDRQAGVQTASDGGQNSRIRATEQQLAICNS